MNFRLSPKGYPSRLPEGQRLSNGVKKRNEARRQQTASEQHPTRSGALQLGLGTGAREAVRLRPLKRLHFRNGLVSTTAATQKLFHQY